MLTIDEIMQLTVQKFGYKYKAPIYLKISNKNSGGDPPAYLIQTTFIKAENILCRIENGDKCGLVIPLTEHSSHISNFAEVVLYMNHEEIVKMPFDKYWELVKTAI